MRLVTFQAIKKEQARSPHRLGSKGMDVTPKDLCLNTGLGSYTGPPQIAVTLAPRSAHSPSVHLHSNIHQVWDTRLKLANSVYLKASPISETTGLPHGSRPAL